MDRTVLGCAAATLLAAAAVRAQLSPELAKPVRLEADGKPIDVVQHLGHAGPLFADVDGDGKAELLVGTFKGNVRVFANTGDVTAPRLADRGLLQAGGKDAFVKNW